LNTYQVEVLQDLTKKKNKSDVSSSWAGSIAVRHFLCFKKEYIAPFFLICWKRPLNLIIILNALCSMPVCQHEKLLRPAKFVEPTWTARRTLFQAFVWLLL